MTAPATPCYTIKVWRDTEAPQRWWGLVECDGRQRWSYVGDSGDGELNVMRMAQEARERIRKYDEHIAAWLARPVVPGLTYIRVDGEACADQDGQAPSMSTWQRQLEEERLVNHE